MSVNISHENELLWCCARTKTNQANVNKVKSLIQIPLDWRKVFYSACRHGIAALMYHNLKQIDCLRSIPLTQRHYFEASYYITEKHNICLWEAVNEVLQNFKAARIKVIVLKGAALAETVYQNIALRPMADIDLLVKKEDLYRTEITLLNLGYAVPERYRYREKKRLYEENHHLPPYVKGKKGICIEVHWNIERPSSLFQIDIDGMWKRARPAKIANVEVLVLSPEDLILHLCLHASFHHKFRVKLRHICDISETIQHYQDEIDWKQLLSITNEYGISKFIYCTLSLTKKMLGTEIPDDVLNELKPDTFDPQLINSAEEMILAKTSSQVPPAAVDAFSPEKTIDKLKVTLRHLFPSRSSVATRFPVSENSIFLYPFYLAYPFNFIKRRWPFLWRFILSDKAILSEFKQAVAQKRRAEILERWLSS